MLLAASFVLVIALTTLTSTQAWAFSTSGEIIKFKDDAQKSAYQELVMELRCPKCQNQNIADSNAVIARDMRVKTKALLDEGYSRQQVIDYMVDRYGQFAHYQPPMTIATSMLWILPGAFVLFGIIVLIRRSQNVNRVQEDADQEYAVHAEQEQNKISDDEMEKLDAELNALLESGEEKK
ncbi:cytochrome c-type biogenesis protein CcmH [Psychrosphaera haliotis]|uniref:Cytochrome c-type biogenesis protein n=2 Tax=Psychrosphaera haliotis TaxID=555083 RepID=A0A6N8F4X2_9GAMM|nr:cytochrome c-type biogenesis protein CcmH [Psychrosphaera haliotis]